MVSAQEMRHSDSFVPIMDGFKQYTALKDSIVFHQATASSIDTNGRTVKLNLATGGEETLGYYALIIGTGTCSPTAATTLHGDHTVSIKALDEMNVKLQNAKEVVIGGGGPVGVESAGEIASHLKGKAKITLVTGSDKLLPVLRRSLSQKAQKQLETLGVKVLYSVKVIGTDEGADGKTVVKLDNGESIVADVYLPAIGMTPNTAFLPDSLKQSNGYVKTNPKTMRVDEAGARVYAVGDVAGVDKGGVMNLHNTIPVWGANFNHDVLGGKVAEKQYNYKNPETQMVPVGAKTGVGAFNGWSIPAFAVSFAKGKDYMISMIPKITEGKQWAKA